MASAGPWAGEMEIHSIDRHRRVEIWDLTSVPTRLRVIRFVLPRVTPVSRLRQQLLPPITNVPVEHQILRFAHPPRVPAVLGPWENDSTLEEVGLEEFSMLTLEMERSFSFSDVWLAFSAYFNQLCVVVFVVLRYFTWMY